jgi:hypothetical protein
MPRKDPTVGIIEVLASDLTYIPNPEQRKVKAAFWTRFNENPLCEANDIQIGDVLRLVGDSRVQRWWSLPGFKEWFRNQEEFREIVESTVYLALDKLREILSSDDPKMASAQVNAAKLLLEVGRKMPQKQAAEKFADEKIGKMGKKELEAFVQKGLKFMPAPKIVDLESEDLLTDDPVIVDNE